MTMFTARLLGVAAAAAAGVLAVQFAYRVRYCLNADPGAVTVRFTCGADDHQTCPSGCSTWRRGFAVFTDERLELWEYRSLDAGPAYCVAYEDIPSSDRPRLTVATDRGPVAMETLPPLPAFTSPGPNGPRTATAAQAGTGGLR